MRSGASAAVPVEPCLPTAHVRGGDESSLDSSNGASLTNTVSGPVSIRPRIQAESHAARSARMLVQHVDPADLDARERRSERSRHPLGRDRLGTIRNRVGHRSTAPAVMIAQWSSRSTCSPWRLEGQPLGPIVSTAPEGYLRPKRASPRRHRRPAMHVAIFDADNHLYETEDAVTSYLPERYKNAIQYVRSTVATRSRSATTSASTSRTRRSRWSHGRAPRRTTSASATPKG